MKKSILIAATAALVMAACDNKKSTPASTETSSGNAQVTTDMIQNPATANPEASKEGDLNMARPVIKFDEEIHDMGQVVDGTKVRHTFKFKNTGNADLLVSNVQAQCGCTTPDWTKTPIKPGESGKVDVEFDSSGRLGKNTKKVTVTTNADPANYELTFNVEVLAKQ